jgi:hypothetical protein
MHHTRIRSFTLKKTLLLLSLTVGAVSCSSQVAGPAASEPTHLGAQAISAVKAPSRLRASDGTSRVLSYATFYQVPDAATLTRLAKRDISFVQPNISPDQMRALQTTGNAAAYLSIGELGTSNTYYVNGQAVSGQSVYNQHVSEGWFVGKNGNFGSYLLDLTKSTVRDFVVSQAQVLLARSFDGLFLDTADDAEFFSNGVTTQAFTSGALTLYAGRPDYPRMRRAYIETIKALRVAVGSNLLIQNGGFDLLLDRQNPNAQNIGDGTQGYIDGVMHEVAITKSNKPAGATDDLTWPTDPANYESWEQYYARIGGTQAQQDRAYRANRDALALEYFRSSGIVFQQDFAVPQNTALQCLSYIYARDLMAREGKSGWLPAYSDASFNKLFDYVDTSAAVRAVAGCAGYDKVTAPDYEVTFSPPSLGVGASRSTVSTLKVTPVNGYTGTVALSLGTLPAGITGTLSQTSVVPGAQTTVSLTFNTGASLAAGTYIIPVKAYSQHESMRYDLRLTVYRTTGDSVWVAQTGTGSVLAYDSSASLSTSSPAPRSMGNGALRQPYAVAVDASGNQYVAENIGAPGSTGQGRVLRYSSFGLYVGGETATISGLNYPTALALDAQNRLWVVQSGLNQNGTPEGVARVSRFDPGSTTEAAGFAPSNLGYPSQVAVQGNTLWLTTTYGLLLRYDVSAAPTLTGIYNMGSKLNAFGGISVAGSSLWLSGGYGVTGSPTIHRAVRLNPAALPVGNSAYGVDGSAAITVTLSSGLYDPAGIGQDALGNVWVVNKTGAVGVTDINSPDHGTLLRFTASSLSSANPVPDLNLDLGSRYPVGLAVGKP